MVFPWLPALFGGEDEDLGDHITATVYNGITTSVGELHVKYDVNLDTIINLGRVSVGSGITTSAHIFPANSNYQVTVGKKLIFIAIVRGSASTQKGFKIRDSATVDSEDGGTLWDASAGGASGGASTQKWSIGPLEASASTFVTIEESTSNTGNVLVDFIGFETAA